MTCFKVADKLDGEIFPYTALVIQNLSRSQNEVLEVLRKSRKSPDFPRDYFYVSMDGLPGKFDLESSDDWEVFLGDTIQGNARELAQGNAS